MTNIINVSYDVTNYFEYLKIHAFSDVKDHHTCMKPADFNALRKRLL